MSPDQAERDALEYKHRHPTNKPGQTIGELLAQGRIHPDGPVTES